MKHFMQGIQSAQHLVTLTSVEDDALGEELQVIWELELGVYVHEKTELPKPTDLMLLNALMHS